MNACLGLMISLLLLPAPAAPGWEFTREAMADLRTIGTVMEAFAVDHNAYPGPTTGARPVEELAKQLEPMYIKKLPRTDLWGKPYYVWSTGKQYLVVSGGADGALDQKYEDSGSPKDAVESPGAIITASEDLVFANGKFVRWLKGAE